MVRAEPWGDNIWSQDWLFAPGTGRRCYGQVISNRFPEPDLTGSRRNLAKLVESSLSPPLGILPRRKNTRFGITDG